MTAAPPFYVGNEAARAASTVVPPARSLVITTEGNIYVADGVTAVSGLSRAVRLAELPSVVSTAVAAALASSDTVQAAAAAAIISLLGNVGAPVRTNLATRPVPQSGGTGWNSSSSTRYGLPIIDATSPRRTGSQWVTLTRTTNTPTTTLAQFTRIGQNGTTPATSPAATPGITYTKSFYAKCTAACTVKAQVLFYDNTGTQIGTTTVGTTVTGVAANTVVRASVTATAPAGTVTMELQGIISTQSGNSAGGEVSSVCDALIEASATLGTYFDGGLTSTVATLYAWTGTAYLSTSTATPSAPLEAQQAGSVVSSRVLKEWTHAEAYAVTSITRDANGVVSSANVAWPDGSTGLLTATVVNPIGAIDAYTITHSASGKTITQPTVTRDGNGTITAQPDLTVA